MKSTEKKNTPFSEAKEKESEKETNS